MKKTKTLIISGAGISRSAGIPTFDENPDMRNILSIEYFQENTQDFWNKVLQMHNVVKNAKPTKAHQYIAAHSCEIITMNLDGLHTAAGSSSVLEVHGNFQNVYCTNPQCNQCFEFEQAHRSFKCPMCGAWLKPSIVLYGEQSKLYKIAFDKLFEYAAADVLIIGTSMKNIFPIKIKKQAEKLHCKIYEFCTNADEELEDYFIEQDFKF